MREQLKATDAWGRSLLTHAVLSGRVAVFDAVLYAAREKILDDEVGAVPGMMGLWWWLRDCVYRDSGGEGGVFFGGFSAGSWPAACACFIPLGGEVLAPFMNAASHRSSLFVWPVRACCPTETLRGIWAVLTRSDPGKNKHVRASRNACIRPAYYAVTSPCRPSSAKNLVKTDAPYVVCPQVDMLLGINKDDGSETVMEEALAKAPKIMASRVNRRDQELKVPINPHLRNSFANTAEANLVPCLCHDSFFL